jgi:hypothetical protein
VVMWHPCPTSKTELPLIRSQLLPLGHPLASKEKKGKKSLKKSGSWK